MKLPFRLIITETTSNTSWERLLETLPASLGRGAGSTVVFAHATISKRHAELVLDGDELVLLDHGSHNGTFSRRGGERVKQRVRLADIDYSFSIGVFDVRVAPPSTRGATVVLTEASARREATKRYDDAGLTPTRLDGAALSADLEPLVERFRNAFGDLFLGISEGIAELEPEHRAKWLRNFLARHDDLAQEPMIRDLLTSIGAPAPPGAAIPRESGPGGAGATRGGARTMLELPSVGRGATRVLESRIPAPSTAVDVRAVATKESS